MYRFLRWLAKPFIALLWPTKVLNKYKFTDETAVICCNHYASEDVVIVAAKLLKKEIPGWVNRMAKYGKYFSNQPQQQQQPAPVTTKESEGKKLSDCGMHDLLHPNTNYVYLF